MTPAFNPTTLSHWLEANIASAIGEEPHIATGQNLTVIIAESCGDCGDGCSNQTHALSHARKLLSDNNSSPVIVLGFLPWSYILGNEESTQIKNMTLLSIPADIDRLLRIADGSEPLPCTSSATSSRLTRAEQREIFAELHRLWHSLVNCIAPLRHLLPDLDKLNTDALLDIQDEWNEVHLSGSRGSTLPERLTSIRNGWNNAASLLHDTCGTSLTEFADRLEKIELLIPPQCNKNELTPLPSPNFLPDLLSLSHDFRAWLNETEGWGTDE